MNRANLLVVMFVAWTMSAAPGLAAIINVVETGGDNEATDTITAKWTGQTWPTSVANEPVPGATVGGSYTTGVFANEAPAFVDRNHRYLNDTPNSLPVPSYLIGQPYIMSGNDNRDNASYKLDVTADTPSTAYILIDNRMSASTDATDNADPPTFDATHMQWIVDQGWIPTNNGLNRTMDPARPDEVGLDEGADGGINQWYSIYRKNFPTGTFSLLQPDNAGQNMYGVVVAPIPEPATAIMLIWIGAAGIAAARRGRRR